MNKEVDKMMEKAAEQIEKFDCSFTGYKECDDCEQTEHNYFHCVAKQILSENNLALIVDKELPSRFLLITHSLQEAYEQAQRDMIKDGWKPVIPLAEELKE